MCGRYTLVEEVNVLAKEFDLGEDVDFFNQRVSAAPAILSIFKISQVRNP
jgi:hypothetical protein